ncbi:MAG: hypothetical protein ACREYE_11015 [Gammaproteobacteria bacterium]
MDAVESIALATGTAWASGINLYAILLMLGYHAFLNNPSWDFSESAPPYGAETS